MACSGGTHVGRWPWTALAAAAGAAAIALGLTLLLDPLRAQDKADRRTLLAGLRYRESCVRTIDCFFTLREFLSEDMRSHRADGDYVRKLPEQGPSVWKYRWATDGTRWRCDERIMWPADDQGPDAFTQRSFDGQEYYFLDLKRLVGWHEAESRGSPYEESVCYLMMTDGSKPLSEALAEENVALVGQGDLRGQSCYKLVRHEEDPQRGSRTITYWLLADGCFPMVRYEYETVWAQPRLPEIGRRMLLTVQEMTHCGEGLVLPRAAKREVYALLEGSECRWQSTTLFSVDEIKVNADLDAEVFVLDFPIGAFVSDDTGRAAHIGGEFNEADTRASQPPIPELAPTGPK